MKKKAGSGTRDLVGALSKGGPEKLNMVLKKNSVVTLRVTEADKRDMQAVAKDCGLTLTEYLTRLHYAARGCWMNIAPPGGAGTGPKGAGAVDP